MTFRSAGIVIALVLVFAVAGCTPPATAGPSLPVDCATFEREGADGAVVERELEVQVNETFVITLCANPSTGFSWEEPTLEGDAGIDLIEHGVDQTIGGPPGEAGQERFTFRTTSPGRDTIHFVYSQPWEGGQKGAWRLDVGVSVTPPGD